MIMCHNFAKTRTGMITFVTESLVVSRRVIELECETQDVECAPNDVRLRPKYPEYDHRINTKAVPSNATYTNTTYFVITPRIIFKFCVVSASLGSGLSGVRRPCVVSILQASLLFGVGV